jgi:catechol-2,3-dioxygenase
MPDPIDPRVDIGHVHLKVADLDRALDFYCGVLGFELQQRIGDDAAFVSAGGYHHHIGLKRGIRRGVHRHQSGAPASFTLRSATRTGAPSPTRYEGSPRRGFRSAARPITA